MGIDPVTLAIAGGLAGLSAIEASQQNRNIKKAAQAEKATQDVAAQQRREVTARELQALEGSILASSAGRGVAGSASSDAISLSTFESAAQKKADIEINRYFGTLATDARANSQLGSPLFAGVQGFGTGLQLGNSLGLGGGGTELATGDPFLPSTSNSSFGVDLNIHNLGGGTITT